MRYRISFIVGMAVGYVLGARAGRERYEQMRKSAREFSQNPAVRNAAESAALNGREAVTKAAGAVSDKFGDTLPPKVSERVHQLRDRVRTHGMDERDDWGTTNT